MKKKILVIDDEKEFVELVKTRLEANGYDILTAFDGDEGIDQAKKEKPDIILLDIMMPKKDGYTVIKDLRKDNTTKDIPVIVLTAKQYMERLFEMEGVSDYILKPFEGNDLLLRIKIALKR